MVPRSEARNRPLPGGPGSGARAGQLFPGIGKLDEQFPGLGADGPSVGESVDVGIDNLDAAIRTGRPGTAIGLSEGAFVVDGVQARLANDPTAPRPTSSTSPRSAIRSGVTPSVRVS